MTRSHKFGEKDHSQRGSHGHPNENILPKYFAKAGFVDADPNKTKKNGGGKGNW